MYNIIKGGASERGDVNTFEEACRAAAPPTRREQCGCLTLAISGGLRTPLTRQLFRMQLLADVYPFYGNSYRELQGCMTSTEQSEYSAEKTYFLNTVMFKNCSAGLK